MSTYFHTFSNTDRFASAKMILVTKTYPAMQWTDHNIYVICHYDFLEENELI